MYARPSSSPDGSGPRARDLDYLVVIHCEGTCELRQQTQPVGSNEQEIIEFAAALVDVKSLCVTKEFRSYCRPKKYRVSDFCTTLTGITQKDVDSADEFPVVLAQFHCWLEKAGLLELKEWAIVSAGEFDVVYFLYTNCNIYHMALPCYYHTFVNLKTLFSDKVTYIRKNPKLDDMLRYYGLAADGRSTDVGVLARLCVVMIERGVIFYPNRYVRLKRQLRCPYKCEVFNVEEEVWKTRHAASMEKISELISHSESEPKETGLLREAKGILA